MLAYIFHLPWYSTHKSSHARTRALSLETLLGAQMFMLPGIINTFTHKTELSLCNK